MSCKDLAHRQWAGWQSRSPGFLGHCVHTSRACRMVSPMNALCFLYLYNLTSSQPTWGSACVLLPPVTTGDSPQSVSLHIPMSCTQPPSVFLGLVGSQTQILEPLRLSPNTSSSKICISKQWRRLWNLHTEVHGMVFMYRGKYFDLCLFIII